jgi:hypothetical protein
VISYENDVVENTPADARFEGGASHEIDPNPKKRAQSFFELEKFKKSRGIFELDENIEVAPGMGLAFDIRAEYSDFRDSEIAPQFGLQGCEFLFDSAEMIHLFSALVLLYQKKPEDVVIQYTIPHQLIPAVDAA